MQRAMPTPVRKQTLVGLNAARHVTAYTAEAGTQVLCAIPSANVIIRLTWSSFDFEITYTAGTGTQVSAPSIVSNKPRLVPTNRWSPSSSTMKRALMLVLFSPFDILVQCMPFERERKRERETCGMPC